MFYRAFAVLCAFVLTVCAEVERRAPMYEPAISPDHSEIAFVSGGDIWTVPATGGVARLLVSHPATESRPLYSPDGKRLAFTSTRTGNGDVYVLDIATGDLSRLTFHEAMERIDSWSPDGKYIYFECSASDIAARSDIQRVRADGGTPMVYSGDRYISEYFGTPNPVSPDTMALTAKGVVNGQWWRNGHSHIDESEIWLRRDGPKPEYQKLSAGGAKEAWPMWSADGRQLYYMSDRSGSENIWVRGGSPKDSQRQVTKFTAGRVLWPSISADGKTIVFERDFGVWALDTASGKAAGVEITLRGVPAGPGVVRTQMTSGFSDLALSPDGKKIAFIARGDVFAASAKDGGNAQRLTSTPGIESNPVWAADNRRVAYTSERDGGTHIYAYDLSKNAEAALTSGAGRIDTSPVWSPDGKSIAYLRDGKNLMIMDVESKAEREVASSYFRLPPMEPARAATWSPDSKWLAYGATGTRLFFNVGLVPAAGGTTIAASFLPNTYGGAIVWSPDGKYVLYSSAQRTETGRVARIDLVPRTPRFREDQFRDLFKDEQPNKPSQPAQPAATGKSDPVPAPSPKAHTDPNEIRVIAEGIRDRLTILPVGIDARELQVSPDGKILLMSGSAAGQTNLWTYSLDELSREPAIARQLTSTPGSKTNFRFTPDSKEVYYLENGRVQSINVETRVAKPVAVTAELDVDFSRDKEEVFTEAWTYLNSYYYDEKFHGADWKGLRTRLQPWIEGSRTPDELRRVVSLMIGELNGSHLGISGPPPAPARTGNLGLRFDRTAYESNGAFRVTEVIQLSPADVAGVKTGETLTAVDGVVLDAKTNLNQLLEFQANRRVTLTIADASGKTREVAVSPVSATQERALLYKNWVQSRRDYVHKVSNGRLGYVHMPDMTQSSLDQFYLDLDAENVGRDGVIVDIRNNNGGFVNAYALDVLSRRPFLQMTPRGMPTVPARSFLGQRSLERPTILVTDMHSLSDAEDFTEGYRAMKLGKVVGEPTAGWIVYTANVPLIDGSELRLPSIRITDMNGHDMERNPRPVDVLAVRPVGETYTGRDSMLDVAAKELLKSIDDSRPTSLSGTPAPPPARSSGLQ